MIEIQVTLYSLTTCVYCNAIKKILDDFGVAHTRIQADTLPDNERQAVLDDLINVNPRCSFPTVVIGDNTVVGYKVHELKELLGIRTEEDELFEKLQKINIPKGYLFNNDLETTFDLLKSLLKNKERYGYMACPCRLASGNRDEDRDIICPCSYRKPDFDEFGSCFCGLYVSDDWNKHRITRKLVLERRPVKGS